MDTPAQLGVICKLPEGALNPLIQIIDKDIKQDWPQNWTGCQLDLTPFTTTLYARPVLYPAKSTPIHTMGSQFLQENAAGNSTEGLTKVQVDDVHSLSFIH